MSTYTFKLQTFGLESLAAFAPRVWFIASEPAFGADGPLVTKRVEATLGADDLWSVELVPSVNTTPNVTYTMRIEWLSSSSNYIGMDVIGGIVAALGGGPIAEMGGIPITRFWAGPVAPKNTEPDTWWLNTITGDLSEWAGGWINRGNLKGPTGTIDSSAAIALPATADPFVLLGGTPAHRDLTFGIPRGVSVTNSEIRANGHLWLETSDGLVLDSGMARGLQGQAGTGAVPADEAFADYIRPGVESASMTALLEGFVPQGSVSIITDAAAPDFSAEVQSKIDSLATFGGGIVEIPKGTFAAAATIKLRQSVRVRGRSKNATDITASGNFPVFQSITPATRIDNVELSNLRIYRVVPAAADTPVVDWTGISHSELRQVTIDQPSSSRHTTVGVLFGAFSYYNKIDMVQVRGVNEGIKFVGEANGNILIACTVLTSNYGFVADNSNSNLLFGCAAEHVDMVGFQLRNKSKKNRVIACRAEDVPICFQVLGGANPAFDNFLVFNLAYERTGGTRYDIQTSNLLIEEGTQRYLNYLARTCVEATKTFGQSLAEPNTPTKVLYEAETVDQLSEYTGSTVTMFAGGLMQAHAGAAFTAVPVGTKLELFLYKNGVVAVKIAEVVTAGAAAQTVLGGVPIKVVAGDKLEIWARASAATAIAASPTDSYFRVTRIA